MPIGIFVRTHSTRMEAGRVGSIATLVFIVQRYQARFGHIHQ
jgi:hypothetical protein